MFFEKALGAVRFSIHPRGIQWSSGQGRLNAFNLTLESVVTREDVWAKPLRSSEIIMLQHRKTF